MPDDRKSMLPHERLGIQPDAVVDSGFRAPKHALNQPPINPNAAIRFSSEVALADLGLDEAEVVDAALAIDARRREAAFGTEADCLCDGSIHQSCPRHGEGTSPEAVLLDQSFQSGLSESLQSEAVSCDTDRSHANDDAPPNAEAAPIGNTHAFGDHAMSCVSQGGYACDCKPPVTEAVLASDDIPRDEPRSAAYHAIADQLAAIEAERDDLRAEVEVAHEHNTRLVGDNYAMRAELDRMTCERDELGECLAGLDLRWMIGDSKDAKDHKSRCVRAVDAYRKDTNDE